jgi:transposase
MDSCTGQGSFGLKFASSLSGLNLLTTLWEEITNYLIQRQTSGFLEGFNNKGNVLKRRCNGIFNLKHLFRRIYLDLHGYRLFTGTIISA